MNVYKTRDELIREAADKLNIVGTGQSLEAEYFDKLNSSVDPLFMQLATDGVCQVINEDQIPSEWFDSLAGLLANICSPLGGKSYDPQIKFFYEAALRRVTSMSPSYNVLESEYF